MPADRDRSGAAPGVRNPLTRPADLVPGTGDQLTCAFTGIAVGLVRSRPVVRRQGHALVLALVLAALLAKGASPVNVLLTDLQNASDSTGLLGSAAVLLVVATGVLAVGAAITHAVTLRKD